MYTLAMYGVLYALAVFGTVLFFGSVYIWLFWYLPRALFTESRGGYLLRVAGAHSIAALLLFGMWSLLYVAMH